MMPTKDLHTHVLARWGMVLHHLDREDICAARGLEKRWCTCFCSHVYVWLIFLSIFFFFLYVLGFICVFVLGMDIFVFHFYLQPIFHTSCVLFQRLKQNVAEVWTRIDFQS